MNSSVPSRPASNPSLFARPAALRAAAALFAAGCAATPIAATGQPWELGQAPQRHKAQDFSAWSYELLPKVAKTREQVVRLQQGTYVTATRCR